MEKLASGAEIKSEAKSDADTLENLLLAIYSSSPMTNIVHYIIFLGLLSMIEWVSRMVEYFFPGRYDIGVFSIVGILAVIKLVEIAKWIQNYK